MKGKKDRTVLKYEKLLQERKIEQLPIIGVDIGSRMIKIVQMKKNGTIKKWCAEDIPHGMVNMGKIEAPASFAGFIKRTLKNHGIKGRSCALCLSSGEAVVREIKLPQLNEQQITENIRQELTSYLALSPDEYLIDYRLLEYLPAGGGAPPQVRVLAAAVPKSLVDSYISTLGRAGLKVTYIDIMQNTVGKIAQWAAAGKKDNICLVDFGARITQIVILKDNNYYVYKTITSGSNYLTELIAEKGEMDIVEAEEYKKKTNFFLGDKQSSLSRHIKNSIDLVITDLERTLEFFKNRTNRENVDKIYMLGGGSLLPGLTGYMKERLSASVSPVAELLHPLRYGSGLGDTVNILPHAIGATLREGR